MKRKLGHILGMLVILNSVLAAYAAEGPIFNTTKVQWLGSTSEIFEVAKENNLKTYYLKTNAPLRDENPKNKEVRIDETLHWPHIRTGSAMFDGLFALAMQEMGQLSVSSIEDHSFDPASCECFETGEKWKYVWTRDMAYAAHLGLGGMDPQRSVNSLRFKLSGLRLGHGGNEQIVQDTGSGGSWPVSTDRVIWALGAFETLLHLPSDQGQFQQFLTQSYRALKNTILTDRFAVFDSRDGLYRGEQSFLDWREQSYPEWTRTNVVHIGMSKSLSTNMSHYIALDRAAQMAGKLGHKQDAQQFSNWAKQLKQSIVTGFWDGTSFSSLKTTYLDQRALKYYDLLGLSLAIIEDVAGPEQARSALRNYPQTLVGPPVSWPQRQDIPIYHNRAIWPFVTAYGLKAAKKIQEPHLLTSYVRSLLLGPAQNLSNMENYEFLTMRSWFNDGTLSGPVVNSRRQLWSVAGHISMVLDVIFGKEVRSGGIRFTPAITTQLRREIFGGSDELKLFNLWFHNHKFNIHLHLPSENNLHLQGSDGLYQVGQVKLNGKSLAAGEWLVLDSLHSMVSNDVEIFLLPPAEQKYSRAVFGPVPRDPHHLSIREREIYYQPKTPVLSPIGLSDNYPLLSFHSDNHQQITYLIYKNGKLLTTTKNTHYLDRDQSLDKTACYSVQARFDSSLNESFPSEPFCYWPSGSIQHYPVGGPHIRTDGPYSGFSSAYGRVYLRDWGNPDQKINLENFTPSRSGKFAVQVDYNNLEQISTGITCAVKKITVIDQGSGEEINSGILFMPHHDHDRYWTDSNFFSVNLKAGNTYNIVIEDFANMSYFTHFESYHHRGGKYGVFNRLNFAEIKVLHLGE